LTLRVRQSSYLGNFPMQPQPIIHSWLQELTAKQHFVKDAALDETTRWRFGNTLVVATLRTLFAWRATAQGRLAKIIKMDTPSQPAKHCL
jgi:uncharacterized protein (DUF924 family)